MCFCLEQIGVSPSHHPNASPTQTHVSVTVLTPEGTGSLSQWQESMAGVHGRSLILAEDKGRINGRSQCWAVPYALATRLLVCAPHVRHSWGAS